MIDGFPLLFFLPLVVHALAGLTTGVTGMLAFRAPKRRGRHHQWGDWILRGPVDGLLRGQCSPDPRLEGTSNTHVSLCIPRSSRFRSRWCPSRVSPRKLSAMHTSIVSQSEMKKREKN
jgi:hypothetical protein